MELAILFWFYKKVDVCEDRLKLLKKYNPNLKIYGLYGGEEKEEEIFRKRLGKYLDDFYMSKEKDSFKKWIEGEMVLVEWYKNRGKNLKWDSVVMAQWDLLSFKSFKKIFEGIKKDEIYLPNYGVVDPDFEERWSWTSKKKDDERPKGNPNKPYGRKMYLEFKEHVNKNYKFNEYLPVSIFMIAVLPRIFFKRFSGLKNKKLGFLEYKLPTYAKIFGIKRFGRELDEISKCQNDFPMNAEEKEILKQDIELELSKPKGFRIFHPYFKKYKMPNK